MPLNTLFCHPFCGWSGPPSVMYVMLKHNTTCRQKSIEALRRMSGKAVHSTNPMHMNRIQSFISGPQMLLHQIHPGLPPRLVSEQQSVAGTECPGEPGCVRWANLCCPPSQPLICPLNPTPDMDILGQIRHRWAELAGTAAVSTNHTLSLLLTLHAVNHIDLNLHSF